MTSSVTSTEKPLEYAGIKLDVPPDSYDNISMMSEKEIQAWVQEATSELYWKFRDDLDDEGAERVKEEQDYLEKSLVKIVGKHITA